MFTGLSHAFKHTRARVYAKIVLIVHKALYVHGFTHVGACLIIALHILMLISPRMQCFLEPGSL